MIFDKIENKLIIDDIEYNFTIESEIRLQEFYKSEKLKFKDKTNLRQDLINSLLNFDIDVLIYFLLVSQDKYNKNVVDDFRAYITDYISKNPTKLNEMFINSYLMFGGYCNLMGFKIEIERGLMILQAKMEKELLNTLLILPEPIRNTVNAELEQLIKSLVN